MIRTQSMITKKQRKKKRKKKGARAFLLVFFIYCKRNISKKAEIRLERQDCTDPATKTFRVSKFPYKASSCGDTPIATLKPNPRTKDILVPPLPRLNRTNTSGKLCYRLYPLLFHPLAVAADSLRSALLCVLRLAEAASLRQILLVVQLTKRGEGPGGMGILASCKPNA